MHRKYIEAELLRRALPYGIYGEPGGAATLYDRYYRPIARLAPDGTRTRVPPDEHIIICYQCWLYRDRSGPRRDRKTRRRCEELLRIWGVHPAALRDEMRAEIRSEMASSPWRSMRRWLR